jgi:PAS domain S-box-containing protein
MILNVDDTPETRDAITRTLERAGFEVTEASTGGDALRLVSRNPLLVLLDVRLPDMSGLEVCRRIKTDPRTATVPVIYLSAAYIDSADRVRGLESGADAYLVQPVEPQELVATVQAVLRARAPAASPRIASPEPAVRPWSGASATHWQALFDGLEDAACVLDRTGHIRRANIAMGRLLGAPSDRLVGAAYDDVSRAAFGNDETALFRDALSERTRTQALVRVAGPRWLSVRAAPLINNHGGLLGALLTIVDVTAVREADQRASVRQAVADILADAPAYDAALPAILRAIALGLGSLCAELWLRDGADDELRRAAGWTAPGALAIGADRDHAFILPLTLETARIGEIRVRGRPQDESLVGALSSLTVQLARYLVRSGGVPQCSRS